MQPIFSKSTLALVLCLMIASESDAKIEFFNYPNGALDGTGAAGAWTGPWGPGSESAPPLGTSPFLVESGQLRVDLTDTPIYIYNESDVRRTLSSPVDTPSVYMSVKITPGEMGNVIPNSFDDGYAGINIGFADTPANVGTNGPTFSTFEFYESFGRVTNVRFATSLGGVFSQSNITIDEWTPGASYQLVGRLDFDASGLDELWSVWLDPINESSIPQVTTTRDLGYSEIGLTQMFHYIYNFENTQDSFFDDLRIGSSWQSVLATPGDTNGDGYLDNTDLAIAISNFTGPQTDPPSWAKTFAQGDTNGDAAVDNTDLAFAISGFTGPAPTSVPEPASLALLALGGLLSARLRRCEP